MEVTSDIIRTVDLNRRPEPFYVTDPSHGGKVTCELCNGFIDERLRYKKIGDRYQHMEQPCNPFDKNPYILGI